MKGYKKQVSAKYNPYAVCICFALIALQSCSYRDAEYSQKTRERISLDKGWHFYKYKSAADADHLIYDVRPEEGTFRDDRPADSKPTEAEATETKQLVLKPWILPTGNDYIPDTSKHYIRPEGDPGDDFSFVQADFDDRSWEVVDLPHDWAVNGPFMEGENAAVGGGMGRLPSPGVGWYRKKLNIPASDQGKSVFLDIDGAMSYAMVWINGHLAGGWPYGYASWRVNLTPYLNYGGENQLAIRLDNPPVSSRWYPGGGIYRDVWLTKTNAVHVGHWGTFVKTENGSGSSATIDLSVTIDNDSRSAETVEIQTSVYAFDQTGNRSGKSVAVFPTQKERIEAGSTTEIQGSAVIQNPELWGPPPTQQPNRYVALTTLLQDGHPIDHYETRFGIRSLRFDPVLGILVNGEHIYIKGVNQHHDLGALGAAFNKRAAERQLEILREMGCNAIRMSHNPPDPQLLELTDSLGFLVMDEIFDVWERKKTPYDFHLIHPEWHEQDLRAFIRRDRNHPSIIMWSVGNEVGEQYTDQEGAVIAKELYNIVKSEDPTRPSTASMNYAKPRMPFPAVFDVISLNYQGEGIRNTPAYAGLRGIHTPPLYEAFHKEFPNKVILSSETASALSSRGTYLFPVFEEMSAPVKNGFGGDPEKQQVSAYELYTAPFGASADKVFASQDKNPYVAGEFVWSGWDYLGEPTPYYLSRSSYSGIIDLAGFKKDRFYLYQSRWRPDLPMAHILPHWNWNKRIGKITPVHVFTSGDEAELFLNGKSLGRKKKGEYEYRLRWDEVVYEPGELKVVAYKNGKIWAENIVRTTGQPVRLELSADQKKIMADGKDLSFVTLRVTDSDGLTVPNADNQIKFSIKGPGELVATDNGDPRDMVSFPSHERKVFNGLALAIIRSRTGDSGSITVTAKSPGVKEAQMIIKSE